jgi:hypothetical protein
MAQRLERLFDKQQIIGSSPITLKKYVYKKKVKKKTTKEIAFLTGV